MGFRKSWMEILDRATVKFARLRWPVKRTSKNWEHYYCCARRASPKALSGEPRVPREKNMRSLVWGLLTVESNSLKLIQDSLVIVALLCCLLLLWKVAILVTVFFMIWQLHQIIGSEYSMTLQGPGRALEGVWALGFTVGINGWWLSLKVHVPTCTWA